MRQAATCPPAWGLEAVAHAELEQRRQACVVQAGVAAFAAQDRADGEGRAGRALGHEAQVGGQGQTALPGRAGLAQAQARKLAAKPPSALMEAKRLMKKGQMQQVLDVIDDEAKNFGRMMAEPAAREAFGAFLEKRKPDFSKV